MTLKTLNHWDFFKLVLVIEYSLIIITAPFMIFLSFFLTESVPTITGATEQAQLIGSTIVENTGELIVVVTFSILVSLIFSAFKAWLLTVLCRHTRLGNIQIGNTKFGKRETRQVAANLPA